MLVIQILFYVLAAVLLALAGFKIETPRIAFGWLGLLSWLIGSVFVPLIG